MPSIIVRMSKIELHWRADFRRSTQGRRRAQHFRSAAPDVDGSRSIVSQNSLRDLRRRVESDRRRVRLEMETKSSNLQGFTIQKTSDNLYSAAVNA